LAINTLLPSAGGIAFDKQGNLYIWDDSSSKIKKVDTSGIITTIAGNGTPGYSGDGGPATSAELFASSGSFPGLAVDPSGNIYISDGYNHVIRKVNTSGVISTIAGTPGSPGFLGDGGPATKAVLDFPAGIALDSTGNLYIADHDNNRVRKVDTNGIITTVAGNGNVTYSGDGVAATATAVHTPGGVTLDTAGNLYISESSDARVRRVDTKGVISTFAGQTKKTLGFSGDGGPATAATLAGPTDLAVDPLGNVFIADSQNGRIRKVNSSGIITTYAGISGTASTPLGDGGPATSAYLGVPRGLALDSNGNLYIGASVANGGHVRKVAAGTVGFVCTNTTPPVITSIDSASAYGGFSYFASGSWLEIKGTNLADPADPRLHAATNPGQWTAADFNGVNAPLKLDGVSVLIDKRAAAVWYISPSQINVQAPQDNAIGSVSITVTNCNATSQPFTMQRQLLAPGLLAPSSFNIGGAQYLAATFNSDGAYVLNTSAGATLGINSRPAKPGDLIIAYGIGFGDVTPSILPGVTVQQINRVSNTVTFSFGSTPATLTYAGLAGNFVGLYEFYITVPQGLANGDYQLNVTQNGIALPQTLYLTVHN
jgi:uncharacterized protein (TIGR03437 family)